MKTTNEKIKIITIAKQVAKYFDLELSDLNKKSRVPKYVEPRQIAHKLCCDLLKNVTLKEIGIQIGGLSHCAVLYSIKVVEDRIFSDKKVKEDYLFLHSKISYKLKDSNSVVSIRAGILGKLINKIKNIMVLYSIVMSK
ncbi:MAG: helix-turn-helix domain-containing protein [Aureibaculum sp.]|nr:helix-turn-helix domain-containing protein [Aureibaculum sp.]